MTVKELIAELQKIDDDIPIYVLNEQGYWSEPAFIRQLHYVGQADDFIRIYGTNSDDDVKFMW